jgi:hypothetical protein
MAFRETAGEVLADLLNELFADTLADSEERRERLRAINRALDRLERAHKEHPPWTCPECKRSYHPKAAKHHLVKQHGYRYDIGHDGGHWPQPPKERDPCGQPAAAGRAVGP